MSTAEDLLREQLQTKLDELVTKGRHRCEIKLSGAALSFGTPDKTTDEQADQFRNGVKRVLGAWFLDTTKALGYAPPAALVVPVEEAAEGEEEEPADYDAMPEFAEAAEEPASESEEEEEQDGVEVDFVEASVVEISSAFQSGGEHAPVLLKQRLTQAQQAGMKQSLDMVENILAGLYRGAESKKITVSEMKKRLGERLRGLKEAAARGEL